MAEPRVPIAGAGPAGLTAALFMARAGVPVRVPERHTEPFEDPRAATIHPPSMEMFAESGVTADLLAQGIRAPVWQFRGRAEGVVAEFDLSILSDVTSYPFRLPRTGCSAASRARRRTMRSSPGRVPRLATRAAEGSGILLDGLATPT